MIWNLLRDARASLMLAQGMPGLVLRELEPFESAPDHVVCFESIRAFALLSLGMGMEALEQTTICVRRGQKHRAGTFPQALFARAGALHQLGRKRAAAQTFDRALAAGEISGFSSATLLPITMLEELLADARARGVSVPEGIEPIPGHPANRLDWSYQRVGTLSNRERGLLYELRTEGTLEVIADRMFLARNTVKAHSRRIYAKLGAQSRTEAVDIAESVGLFDVPGLYWSTDSLPRAS
jgi:DNA-binding CsgD family transcriptional regulator